jgi:hypothetical protein
MGARKEIFDSHIFGFDLCRKNMDQPEILRGQVKLLTIRSCRKPQLPLIKLLSLHFTCLNRVVQFVIVCYNELSLFSHLFTHNDLTKLNDL